MIRQPGARALATAAMAVVLAAGTESAATRVARDVAPPTPAHAAAKSPQDVAPPLRLDVTVRDPQGKPVGGLDASLFTVAVDGAPRRVVSARHVFRGPGSEASARGAAVRPDAGSGGQLFDPSRAILVIVDETSFPRGGEKSAISVADRLLDRFGSADQVAVVTAPTPEGALAVSFGDDRATIRETLARVQGRSIAADPLALADQPLAAPAVDPAAASGAGASTTGDETPPPKMTEEPRRDQVGGDKPLPSNERHEHALETLTRLVAGLRVAPGPKTVVFVTAGLAEMDRASAAAVRGFVQTAETEAARSRVALYVLGLSNAGQTVSWNELEQLSAATGGEMVRVGRNVEQALDRVGLALSSTYCVEVEGAAADRDPRGRAVRVTVGRANVTARTARRIVARSDPPYLTVPAATSPSGTAGGARDLPDEAAPTAAARPSGRTRREPDAELDALVARATEYLAGYLREFKNVVAEEDYTQMNMAVRPAEIRRTKSDFLLAMAPDGKSLVPFRDVFEVDGRAVRDREDRLKKLFLDYSPSEAVDAAARVQTEGARYNLVSTRTTVNVPTFALSFLVDPFVKNVQFRRGREETVENTRVIRLDFEEVGHPTAVFAPTTGADIPSTGSVWLDPLTGRVVKTYLRAADEKSSLSLESTVTYKRSDALGLWVPSEMRETYRLRGYSTEGRAGYSNFRSFQVKTQQEIKVDKK